MQIFHSLGYSLWKFNLAPPPPRLVIRHFSLWWKMSAREMLCEKLRVALMNSSFWVDLLSQHLDPIKMQVPPSILSTPFCVPPNSSNETRVRRIHPAAGRRLIMLSMHISVAAQRMRFVRSLSHSLVSPAPENNSSPQGTRAVVSLTQSGSLVLDARLQCGGIRWRALQFSNRGVDCASPSVHRRIDFICKCGPRTHQSMLESIPRSDQMGINRVERKRTRPCWLGGKLPTIAQINNQRSILSTIIFQSKGDSQCLKRL